MKEIEVNIDGGLEINTKIMTLEIPYRFIFLDIDMIAFRTQNSLELWKEDDWLDLEDAMERQIK